MHLFAFGYDWDHCELLFSLCRDRMVASDADHKQDVCLASRNIFICQFIITQAYAHVHFNVQTNKNT